MPGAIDRANGGQSQFLEEADGAWQDSQIEYLQERLADLELAREDVGWIRLVADGDTDFSRQGLQEIVSLARIYALRNPLIKRAVWLQGFYVFGQGMAIVAKDERVQRLIDDFVDDRKNQTELTSHQARTMKEQELQITGNLFFAFFVNAATGRVRLRTIPFEQMQEIYYNPEDAKDPWFYKRRWRETRFTAGATSPSSTERTAWYPDWRYTGDVPATLGRDEVINVPVYHVKVGGLPDMRYGVSEVYQAIDWARGYKEFLTDWATLVKALSRFAWKATVKGGTAARAIAKDKLGRMPTQATEAQINRVVAGSTWIGSEGADLSPIPKTGATTSAEDGRRLLLMVCAAVGLPETFFGDVSVGTLATATSLDRPTELKFRDRQTLWADIHRDILDYLIDRSIASPSGALTGYFQEAEGGEPGEGKWILDPPTEVPPGTEPPEQGDRGIEITFPPILEHDVAASVTAAVGAVTLNGSQPNKTIFTPRQAGRVILTALGIDNVDEWLDEAFPVDDQGNPVERPDQVAAREQALAIAQATQPAPGAPQAGNTPPAPGQQGNPATEAFHEAVRELVAAVETMKVE